MLFFVRAPAGIRTNLTRTITVTMSSGEFLRNVASLTGLSDFQSNLSGVYWNQHARSSPSWDSFCFDDFIYDPDGSGCTLCPDRMCADEGKPVMPGIR